MRHARMWLAGNIHGWKDNSWAFLVSIQPKHAALT
jgi:hypothetical protein